MSEPLLDILKQYNLHELTCQNCNGAMSYHTEDHWLNGSKNIYSCSCGNDCITYSNLEKIMIFKNVNYYKIELSITSNMQKTTIFSYRRVGKGKIVRLDLQPIIENDSILFSNLSNMETTIMELETLATFS